MKNKLIKISLSALFALFALLPLTAFAEETVPEGTMYLKNGEYYVESADGLYKWDNVDKTYEKIDGANNMDDLLYVTTGVNYIETEDGVYILNEDGTTEKVEGLDNLNELRGVEMGQTTGDATSSNPDNLDEAGNTVWEKDGEHYIETEDGVYKVNSDGTYEQASTSDIADAREVGKTTGGPLTSETEDTERTPPEGTAWQKDGEVYIETEDGVYRWDQESGTYEDASLSDIVDAERLGETTPQTGRPPVDEDSLKEAIFDVSNILSLDGDEQPQSYFEDEQGYSPIVSLVLRVINFAIRIIGSIAVIIFIVAGFMFMLAKGDETRLTNAKEVVKYAIIGLLITFLSYIIVIFVQSLFDNP